MCVRKKAVNKKRTITSFHYQTRAHHKKQLLQKKTYKGPTAKIEHCELILEHDIETDIRGIATGLDSDGQESASGVKCDKSANKPLRKGSPPTVRLSGESSPFHFHSIYD